MCLKLSVGRRASAVKTWFRRAPGRVGRRVENVFKSEPKSPFYLLHPHVDSYHSEHSLSPLSVLSLDPETSQHAGDLHDPTLEMSSAFTSVSDHERPHHFDDFDGTHYSDVVDQSMSASPNYEQRQQQIDDLHDSILGFFSEHEHSQHERSQNVGNVHRGDPEYHSMSSSPDNERSLHSDDLYDLILDTPPTSASTSEYGRPQHVDGFHRVDSVHHFALPSPEYARIEHVDDLHSPEPEYHPESTSMFEYERPQHVDGFHNLDREHCATPTSMSDLEHPEHVDGCHDLEPTAYPPLPSSPAYGCLPLPAADLEYDALSQELEGAALEDEPSSSRHSMMVKSQMPDEVVVDDTIFITMRPVVRGEVREIDSSKLSSQAKFDKKPKGSAGKLRRVNSRITDTVATTYNSHESHDIGHSTSTGARSQTEHYQEHERECELGHALEQQHGPQQVTDLPLLPNTDRFQWPKSYEMRDRFGSDLDGIEEVEEEIIEGSLENSFQDSGIFIPEDQQEHWNMLLKSDEEYIEYSFEEALTDETIKKAIIEQARLHPAYHLAVCRKEFYYANGGDEEGSTSVASRAPFKPESLM